MSKLEIKYRINRRLEKILISIVWKLPRKVVMWSAIRVVAHATDGKYSNQVVPDLLAMDALKRWDASNIEKES